MREDDSYDFTFLICPSSVSAADGKADGVDTTRLHWHRPTITAPPGQAGRKRDMTGCSSSTRPHGYHGRSLSVDLSTASASWNALDEGKLRSFLGGSGLGTFLLLKEDVARVDPLGPDSAIIFSFSPLVGSPLTTSAKFAIVCKSPLTHRISDSLVSSYFALAGKRAGCDAFIIRGRVAEPSVLLIDNGTAKIEPCKDLWGTTCAVAEAELRKRYGAEYQVAVIGPAGERLVRYATISHAGRHAGRGGSGAVLGSKNLKAVLVRGTQRCTWADPEALHKYAKRLSADSFGPATAKYRELGTAANTLVFNRLNALPTRNFQFGSFAQARNLAPESLATGRTRTRASCAACTIGCEHIYALDTGTGQSESSVRVEYESLFALGALCGIGDSEQVLRASQLCDELGMDTISAGGTVAFAMECAERAILDEPWLRFGDGNALLKALQMIGRREGLGDRLAEGSRLLSQHLGSNSHEFAPHVKGLELPGYEPRAMQTMALGLAVGARGADHNRSGAYEADFSARVNRRELTPLSAEWAVATESQSAIFDSLILCKFIRRALADTYESAAEMLRMVSGWPVTAEELLKTAQRIVTARKLFNVRAGWTPAEDTLPPRFFELALPDDPNARLSRHSFREAVRTYNLHRGWSADGWPEEQQIKDLKLDEC
jgi:aldehyde:ferredoxin oxidoreductase